MTFIKQYPKTGDLAYEYNDSKKQGEQICHVGTVRFQDGWAGLVLRTDLEGNVLWEYAYVQEEDPTRYVVFRSLEFCDNGDVIVTAHHDDSVVGLNLLRIDIYGNVIWSKYHPNGTGALTKIVKVSHEEYVILDTYGYTNGETVPDYTWLFKIDGDGNVLENKRLYFDGIFAGLSKLAFDNGKILVCGTCGVASSFSNADMGLFLEFDNSLALTKKLVLSDPSDTFKWVDLRAAHYYRGNLILCGESHQNDIEEHQQFFIRLSLPLNNGPVISKRYEQNLLSSVTHFHPTGIYNCSDDRGSTLVMKLNYNFEPIWTKLAWSGQFFHEYIKQVNENDILVQATTSSSWSSNPLGRLNLELDSCNTLPAEVPTRSAFTFHVNKDFPVTIVDYPLALEVKAINKYVIESHPIEICPTEPDEGCVKDTTLCDIYTNLNQTYLESGLVTPYSWNPQTVDFPYFAADFQLLHDKVQDVVDNNPGYELSGVFAPYIWAIGYFSKEMSEETYIAAWDAVQAVLEYLLEQGNCYCGNTFAFTSSTQLQSSDFYLQAAGSDGSDSAEGVHLRWLFKNRLALHLPKANYAANTANFNKPDDFVRIYRAPYESQPVLIDFDVPPTIVRDNIRTWIYRITANYGDYVFHITFPDTSDYDQARQLFDPSVNPQDFLEQYAGVIEITNKTQLSFAIKPVFVEKGTIRLELLSVEENKITAPKVCTHRMEYDFYEIQNTKVFAENIRTIRIQSSSSVLYQLYIEPYNEFIRYSEYKKEWAYLGRHALTLDTQLALSRFSPPGADALVNWLNFNDQAYVNEDNYADRWNGSESIRSTVQRYLQLSNDPLNPAANEDVLGDDGQAVGTADFSFSSLHLLQMGSLDYHVARMLGLGKLDLDHDLKDGGEYIYLAEYTTFADLDDGLGARRVDHVYSSLPTSTNTKRLPVPVELQEPVPGIKSSMDIESDPILGDNDGYSFDGRVRYISLMTVPFPEEEADQPFFYQPHYFTSFNVTIPVFAGLEYKAVNSQFDDPGVPWIKPELCHHDSYLNRDETVDNFLRNETVPLLLPDPGFPLYVHREHNNGWHVYGSYGINWFSRASTSSITHLIETKMRPYNSLKPPYNVNAVLVQAENPLLLTSADEQVMRSQITGDDKTLVRLTFNYDTANEMNEVAKSVEGELIDGFMEPDPTMDFFAEDLELYFRKDVPFSFSGKIESVTELNEHLCQVVTAPFIVTSAGFTPNPVTQVLEPNQSIDPILPTGMVLNFVGALLSVDGNNYIIHSIDASGTYPVITLYKRDVSAAMSDEDVDIPEDGLLAPSAGTLFVAVENMQSPTSWGTPNPRKISLGWSTVFQEEITHQDETTGEMGVLQRFRGVYRNALIEKVLENVDLDNDGNYDAQQYHLGLYKATFSDYTLPIHPQYAPSTDFSVEFWNGIVRVHTLQKPTDERKTLEVLRKEQQGPNLILYFQDPAFPSDLLAEDYEAQLASYEDRIIPIGQNSVSQYINYYPGYRVYLKKDELRGLKEQNLLPETDGEVRYSIFGLRSHDLPNENQYDNVEDYYSKFSVPALMFARSEYEPATPQQPQGPTFATRPDFYGKSTYTFDVQFVQKPYAVLFGRASDIQLLTTAYSPETIATIEQTILMGGSAEWFKELWEDFLKVGANIEATGFTPFGGVSMPLPDSPNFLQAIQDYIDGYNTVFNENQQDLPAPFNLTTEIVPAGFYPNGLKRNERVTVRDFLKEALQNCFVSLTEMPVIFDYVKGNDYVPVPKRQSVRDKNGALLSPSDPEFDMAPMMKKTLVTNQIRFTDFGLDGASHAHYFYSAREMSSQMVMSAYSTAIGPISMVNSSAPVTPSIVKVVPVLPNNALGISPAVEFSINAYSAIEKVTRIEIFRALSPTDTVSVRSMKLVQSFDEETFNLPPRDIWVFRDDFNDLEQIPYGDPLFYRIVAYRKIQYADPDGNLVNDYAPSEASNTIVTNIYDPYPPESPVMAYTAEPITEDGILHNVVFTWPTMAYKGTYHVYKMSPAGNWNEIGTTAGDDTEIVYPLSHGLGQDGSLKMLSETGFVHHHFKIVTESPSGHLSSQEKILTVSPDPLADYGGISRMMVGTTFIVRPNT